MLPGDVYAQSETGQSRQARQQPSHGPLLQARPVYHLAEKPGGGQHTSDRSKPKQKQIQKAAEGRFHLGEQSNQQTAATGQAMNKAHAKGQAVGPMWRGGSSAAAIQLIQTHDSEAYQSQPDEPFEHLEQGLMHGVIDKQHRHADQQQRSRVAEAPEQSAPRRRPQALALRYDVAHRYEVVGLKGMGKAKYEGYRRPVQVQVRDQVVADEMAKAVE